MSQNFRISGGLVDPARAVSFRFNDEVFEGYQGDTLASALLANGQHLVGRSFKYHRPRGIIASGSEEPNALVTLGEGAEATPNTRATCIELRDGLQAHSQNHLGTLENDLFEVNDLFSPFLGAGFYYKTFMWPSAFWEKIYEPIIRRSAGLGQLSGAEDPAHYEKGYRHCDLLIIGAGPAGLSAALSAGRSGLRVILADEDFQLGGRLLAERYEIDGQSGADWASSTLAELASLSNVQIMSRTSVLGAFDHGIFGALQDRSVQRDRQGKGPRQVLWRIYAKRSMVCGGATERSIAFGNNDRPGVMLAGAVRAYANRWGVAPGRRVAVFTNNDDGWRTALDLEAKGIEVVAVVDPREQVPAMAQPKADVFMGQYVLEAHGHKRVSAIKLSNGAKIDIDCLAVSGGWNPNVHLTCHHGTRPVWREELASFVPGENLPAGMSVSGAAAGDLSLGQVLRGAWQTAAQIATECGVNPCSDPAPKADDETTEVSAFWRVTDTKKRAWVDFQNDVTVKDVKLAHTEGMLSVEHLKRYTTLGMATDQGKTANVLGLAIMAQLSGKTIAETGTTMFRPPYTPVPIAAFAGHSRGEHFRPTRKTPSHAWAEEQGAQFVEAGAWLRAQWFPQDGDTHWRQTVDREVANVRSAVGVCDVTTLGKIDIQGKDAAAFLNFVYANGFAKLPVGKTRYGLMLREDGIVMDDGTTARLGENHFVMTTTTAKAGPVFAHLEFCRQGLCPDMDVQLISSTDQWAQFAVAGPNSRKLLQKIVDPGVDLSNEGFPFMACAEIPICGGIKARLFRISFSGELAYEIAVPARYGDALIRVLMQAGEDLGVVPYGTEALGVMRIEKGHPAGNELNGQTTARDLGFGRMVSKKKDCIGNTLSEREGLNREDGLSLVGFAPVDGTSELVAGAHFIAKGASAETANDEGWMSSTAYSPIKGHSIGLGFIQRGDQRKGEIVRAVNPVQGSEVDVEIVDPVFVDPEGEALRG